MSLPLGEWVYVQRVRVNPDSERGKLLKQIGVRFEKKRNMLLWNEWYYYAEIYYKHHKNLNMSQNFKTDDGYNYAEDGKIALGMWVYNQKRHYENKTLSNDKIKLLEKIGMVWSIEKNYRHQKYHGLNFSKICNDYKIDIEKNYNVLNSISLQELTVKIEYLKSKNIPLYNKKGILHEIFNMSSMDIKEKYGISLEEMINIYKIKNNRILRK